MGRVDETIKNRARRAVAAATRHARVVKAYLFGSQVDGTQNSCSDIDVALFVEGLAKCDLHQIARISARVQKEAGDDIDVHLLPAESMENSDEAAFSSWVVAHGVEIASLH